MEESGMYIANNETALATRGILTYMPQGIRRYMYGIDLADAREIRLRLGKPLMIASKAATASL